MKQKIFYTLLASGLFITNFFFDYT